MMKPFHTYVALLALLVVSCSPSKRIARILKNHPEAAMDTVWVQKTFTEIDTVVLDSIVIDTAWVSRPMDTLIIEKERVRVQLIRHNDTIFANILDSDTLFIHDTVSISVPHVTRTVTVKGGRFFLKLLPWLLLLIAAAVLIKLLRK